MKNNMKRILALVLALAMVMGLAVTGVQAVQADVELSYEKLDSISTQLMQGSAIEENENAQQYADTDMVRVTIVLEQPAAISKAPQGSKELTAEVARERAALKVQQEKTADAISVQALGGEELDVVWNLTLAANAISANVQYGQIGKIQAVEGVKSVFVETRYMPLVAESNNIVAGQMTGANVLQDSGYTGAGSRVAIIDTGTDPDHQSFSNEGFLYSLALNAEEKGMETEEYIDSLNLLDAEEIASVLDQLHVASRYPGITAEDLYGGAKQAFNYNYIDNDVNTTHDFDDNGSHGSHVAGIAAANSYIAVDNLYDFNADGVMDVLDAQALMDYAIAGTAISNTPAADINDDGTVTDLDVHELLNIIGAGTAYVDAAGTVGVEGVAPDAQIITMKVFGVNGGAYSSDYMAAVEDAIVLGCDVANLSLGAANPGFSIAYEETQFTNEVMELVGQHDMVMAVAAGNSGNWADQDHAYQMMYADEAGTYTTSEPAVYANALSVASADNVGLVSNLKTEFGGSLELVFNPASGAETDTWESMDADAVGTDYPVVFLGDPTGLLTGGTQTDERIYAGSEADFAGFDFTGKVVLVSRGTYNFSAKHMNAAAAGAAAVLIYNNVEGDINASIEGTTATIPCATIGLADAQALYELFTLNDEGLYEGTLTVTYGLNVNNGEDVQYPTMSSFSSWGTTGSLSIKPEITAPGGGIYSVNGVDPSGAAYENMSGTSMATPHVAGLTALAAQYMKENDLIPEGMDFRSLTQSLMMSTATPLIEEATGLEYSVRNQGAGLANIEAMVNAESYILVKGQDGGKVKVELGDGTEGKFFTFTINNLTDRELQYELSESILTTSTVTVDGFQLSADQMTRLDARVSYGIDGRIVTVPAGGSASVTAYISVPAETVAEMEALGYVNGFYVEGYIYATPVTTEEGVVGVTHSIPLLGWYGNWTDPSMYDKGSLTQFLYEGVEYPPHIGYMEKNFLAWNIHGDTSGQYYVGNVYGVYDPNTGTVTGDSRYLPERNAINSTEDRTWDIFAIFPTLIRNAADFKVEVTNTDTGEVYYVADYVDYQLLGSFYYANAGQWYDTTLDAGVGPDGWNYTDAEGNTLPDGTNFTVTLYCAPDYYVENGTVTDWSLLGEGIDMSYSFTVDNQAPQLSDMDRALTLSGDNLFFTVEDNNFVAAVVLLNGSGNMVMDYYYPDMDLAQEGMHTVGWFDISDYKEYLGQKVTIAVCDYAGNESYYSINLGGEGASYGDFVAFQYDPDGYANTWVSFSEGVANTETSMFTSEQAFVAAEYVNGLVFAQDDTGRLYGIPYEDMLANSFTLEETYITTLNNTYQDFAYNYSDGKLYGLVTYESDGYPTSELHTINLRGEYYDSDMWMNVEAYQEDWAAQRGGVYALALAIDDTGAIYILGPTYDWDTEELTETAHLWKAEMEESWWGASLGAFTDVGDTGMGMDYLQSMTWNHNTESLYWAQFYPVSWLRMESNLVKIDPATAQCEIVGELYGETCALFAPLTAETAAKEEHLNVPDFDASVTAKPNMSVHSLTMGVGKSETISLTFDPWYSTDKEVVWTSSDESVVTVDNGVVTAVGSGAATVTVAAANDESLFDQCEITVASLTLNIEGILSHTAGGINSVYGSKLYDYSMIEGVGEMTLGSNITAPEQFQGFGLNIASAVEARDSLWVSEFGNAGMVYQVNKDTGVIEDMFQPIDGDMMFGLGYSEATDMFTGIMNYYLYVDLAMNDQMEQDILDSYDEEQYMYTYHRFDMSEYLRASDENFNTGESGNGSIVDVVMAGVTAIDNTDGTSYYAYMDYQGGYMGGEVSYTPATTLVILDNVGRLWYIDETVGMSLTTDDWGNTMYTKDDGSYIGINFGGSFAQEYTDENGNVTYNVFVIRQIVETPLTDMYRNGNMVRYTYHFSDIHYAGTTADGAPMFFLSLYDYWNEGVTNQLYLYIPGVGTGEFTWDENWNRVEIKTPDSLYDLGTTGDGNIIATITGAELLGGLPESSTDSVEAIGTRRIYAGAYTE